MLKNKRQIRWTILSLLSSSLLMVGFLNCSKTGFQASSVSTTSASQASSGSGAGTGSGGGATGGSNTTTTPLAPVVPGTPLVPVLMAQGSMGRTVMSCDDGQTWINDRSDDDLARCGVDNDPHYVECDHSTGAGRGLTAGDVGFFANFGWGYPGTVRASNDGKNWSILLQDGKSFSGNMLSYVKGMLIVFTEFWSLSADQGKTWSLLPKAMMPAAADYTHAYSVGDNFILTSREGIIAVGAKDGKTWFSPASFNPNWGMNTERGSQGGFALGNGVIVGLGYNYDASFNDSNYASRSTDGGKTWTGKLVFQQRYVSWSSLVFTGTEFVAWAGTNMWRSADGVNWTSTPVLSGISSRTDSPFKGPVTMTPKGTFVAISSDNGSYDYQYATRSTDGVHWTRVPTTNFKGGHPVEYLVNGYVPASACGK